MDVFTKWTLLLQLAATLPLVGLIWFVQIVHYPLFSKVGRDEFERYEVDHQRLTTMVVLPLMLTELATAILLLWLRPVWLPPVTLWCGLGLLISIWLVTFTVQVPQHASLSKAYDAVVQRKLVLGNWFRTIAWTARGVLLLWIASRAFDAAAAVDLVR